MSEEVDPLVKAAKRCAAFWVIVFTVAVPLWVGAKVFKWAVPEEVRAGLVAVILVVGYRSFKPLIREQYEERFSLRLRQRIDKWGDRIFWGLVAFALTGLALTVLELYLGSWH